MPVSQSSACIAERINYTKILECLLRILSFDNLDLLVRGSILGSGGRIGWRRRGGIVIGSAIVTELSTFGGGHSHLRVKYWETIRYLTDG